MRDRHGKKKIFFKPSLDLKYLSQISIFGIKKKYLIVLCTSQNYISICKKFDQSNYLIKI
jgi:hypothetical protein